VSLASHLVFEDLSDGVGAELVAVTLVEFVLEFDPVQTEGVQEALHGVHAHEHAEGDREEGEEGNEEPEYRPAGCLRFKASTVLHKDQLQEDSGQLRVSEGESPKTEVGGCV
jgi:hypothetical protein